MIVYGCAIASEEHWTRYARPGIERVREAGDVVITRRGYDSVQEPYNSILDEAAGIDGLEALVLVHDDLEIRDPALAATARRTLAPGDVALVGAVGARGSRGVAWWWGAEPVGTVIAPRLGPGFNTAYPLRRADVDVVDGMFMVLSPWAVTHLRLDPRFARTFHGYDVDLSLQARVAGYRVRVEPIEVAHHSSYGLLPRDRRRSFLIAARTFQDKWGELERTPIAG